MSRMGSPGRTRKSRKLNVTTANRVPSASAVLLTRNRSLSTRRHPSHGSPSPVTWVAGRLLHWLDGQVVLAREVEDQPSRYSGPARPSVVAVGLELVLVPHDYVRGGIVVRLLHVVD